MLNLISVSSDKIDKSSEKLRNELFGICSSVSICCRGERSADEYTDFRLYD